jgi:hypothetical protein
MARSLLNMQWICPTCNIQVTSPCCWSPSTPPEQHLNASQEMARPERFELPTNWFEASYSIQLSYGRLSGAA